MFDCFFSCHRSVKEYLARKKVNESLLLVTRWEINGGKTFLIRFIFIYRALLDWKRFAAVREGKVSKITSLAFHLLSPFSITPMPPLKRGKAHCNRVVNERTDSFSWVIFIRVRSRMFENFFLLLTFLSTKLIQLTWTGASSETLSTMDTIN